MFYLLHTEQSAGQLVLLAPHLATQTFANLLKTFAADSCHFLPIKMK